MGELACAAGFIGYFVTFNYFGFPVKSLFGKAVASGYKPPVNDFKSYNGNPYYNVDLEKATKGDCNLYSKEANKLKYDIDWFLVDDGKFDLRKAMLKCNSEGKWVPDTEWSYCNIDSDLTHSVITGTTACYSTDAIKWAQSVYFVCIVLV